jgi:hypothetical protein
VVIGLLSKIRFANQISSLNNYMKNKTQSATSANYLGLQQGMKRG